MTVSLKIPFALDKNDRIVDVRELPPNAKGDYRCAGCKNPVTLKQGEIKTWHFAHKPDTACTTAFETALHALAKQILAGARFLHVPELVCHMYNGLQDEADIHLCEKQALEWDAPGELEKWLEDGVRPDFMAVSAGTPFLVEVAVTHFSDTEKIAKLRQLKLPTLEIDLSDLPRDVSASEVRQRVLTASEGKQWIFYPGEEEARARLKLLREENEAKRLAALARTQEEARQRQAAREAREKAKAEAHRLKVEQANARYRQSTYAEKLAFLGARLELPEQDWPACLGTKVRGASKIPCSPRVWQADVFRRFIHSQLDKQREPSVTVESVAEWLSLRYGVPAAAGTSVRVAVWDFFSALEQLGYLKKLFRQEFAIKKDRLAASGPAADLQQAATRSATRGLFWSSDYGTESDLWQAARSVGVHVSPNHARWLLDGNGDARYRLSEEDYAVRVASTLEFPLEQAVALLVSAKVFVKLGASLPDEITQPGLAP